MQRTADIPPTLAWNISAIFRVFEFLQVNSDARALREAFGFQLQLDGCKHEVMIAVNIGTWERPCVGFVDAGRERWDVSMKSL